MLLAHFGLNPMAEAGKVLLRPSAIGLKTSGLALPVPYLK